MLSLYLLAMEKDPEVGSRLTIEGDEVHHMAKVARHRIGERVSVTDGSGLRATIVIESIDQRSVTGVVEEVTRSDRHPVTLRVVQGLTKSDRAHECIELLVAAGVDEIVPWGADRSIGKWDPVESSRKWEQWIRAAVKQTRRDRIPICAPFQSHLREIIGERKKEEFVIALHESASMTLDSALLARWKFDDGLPARITLIIGPEGGLSEREETELDGLSIPLLRLGTPVFRSAHAGAIALSALQASFSLWR
jgi:16S rRNA (uracil1498-N3)-methyltransferase